MYNKEELDKICSHINKTELNSKRAERDSIKFKQVEYLMDKVGHEFNGNISDIKRWGVYVVMENSCTGLIQNNSDIKIEENKYFVNVYNGRQYNIGDSIVVKVIKVNLIDMEVDLEIVD